MAEESKPTPTSQPAPSTPPQQQQPSMMKYLQTAGAVAALGFALVYAIGFVVVAIYYGRSGIPISVGGSRIGAAGVFPSAVVALTVLITYSRRRDRPLLPEGRSRAVLAFFTGAAATSTLLTAFSGLVLVTTWGFAPGPHIPLVVGMSGSMLMSASFVLAVAGFASSKTKVIVVASGSAGMLGGAALLGMIGVTLWVYTVALFVALFVDLTMIGLASPARSELPAYLQRYMFFMFLLMSVWWYGDDTYTRLPQAMGGGRPTEVLLGVDAHNGSACQAVHAMTAGATGEYVRVRLIEHAGGYFYVLPAGKRCRQVVVAFPDARVREVIYLPAAPVERDSILKALDSMPAPADTGFIGPMQQGR